MFPINGTPELNAPLTYRGNPLNFTGSYSENELSQTFTIPKSRHLWYNLFWKNPNSIHAAFPCEMISCGKSIATRVSLRLLLRNFILWKVYRYASFFASFVTKRVEIRRLGEFGTFFNALLLLLLLLGYCYHCWPRDRKWIT